MSDARRWDPDRPDEIDPVDYIIGSTLGWWTSDNDSMQMATVAAVAQALLLGGLSSEDAVDKAFEIIAPDGGDGAVDITVKRSADGYRVQFRFGDYEVGLTASTPDDGEAAIARERAAIEHDEAQR